MTRDMKDIRNPSVPELLTVSVAERPSDRVVVLDTCYSISMDFLVDGGWLHAVTLSKATFELHKTGDWFLYGADGGETYVPDPTKAPPQGCVWDKG